MNTNIIQKEIYEIDGLYDQAVLAHQNANHLEANEIFKAVYNKYNALCTQNLLQIDLAYLEKLQKNIAKVNFALGEYQESLTYFLEALKTEFLIYPEAKNMIIAGSYNDIAVNYGKLENYDQSLVFYKKSLSVTTSLYNNQDHAQTAQVLKNVGTAYYFKGNTDSDYLILSLHYLNKALTMQENLNLHNIDTADTLNNLGATYEKLSDLNKSIEHYNAALLMKLKLHDQTEDFTAEESSSITLSLNNLLRVCEASHTEEFSNTTALIDKYSLDYCGKTEDSQLLGDSVVNLEISH